MIASAVKHCVVLLLFIVRAVAIDMTEKIYIALQDEGTETWRPVSAEQVYNDVYRITSVRTDETEKWEFNTGDLVRCCERRFAGGDQALVAFERVEHKAN